MRNLLFIIFALISFYSANAQLQQKMSEHIIYVNKDVTTSIIFPEPIKIVDISTDTIAGTTATNNILKIKPKGILDCYAQAATLTIIGERFITNYKLVYTTYLNEAIKLKFVDYNELSNYKNPLVSMSQKEMSKYAWAIYTSKRKYNNITAKSFGCKMIVNNIYTIGDYFFIDFSIYNKSNISYAIDELRIKLEDKKQTKATTSQTIELTPIFILNNVDKFKKAYRNVIVLDRLTYPEDKLLYIEIYEKQISGRNIRIPISYEDILHADGTSTELIKNL